MQKSVLSVSILSANFAHLEEDIHTCEKAGCDWIHIDVMDGHFVPNITMGPFIVEWCKKITALPLDVHLMIENSDRFTDKFIQAGASHVSVHIEGNHNIQRILQTIRSAGVHPGIVINPGTSPILVDTLLPYVDMVLVMTVNPGFSGQKFIPECIAKIAAVRASIDKQDHPIRLEVDGGINSETAKKCLQAGADTFVVSSAIFSHPESIAAGVKEIIEAIK